MPPQGNPVDIPTKHNITDTVIQALATIIVTQIRTARTGSLFLLGQCSRKFISDKQPLYSQSINQLFIQV